MNMQTRRTSMAWILFAVAALTLTGWLYTRPDMAILLAEQIWACFGV